MKKVITILAIMIVLIGAVFADSAAQSLTVTCVIPVGIPTFALKGGATSGTYGVTADTDTTSTADYNHPEVALSGDIVSEDLTAYFQVLQTANANLSMVYNFTVSAGQMVRQGKIEKINNVDTVVADGRSYTINKTVTVSKAAKNSTTDGMTYISINDAAGSGAFTVTYTGSVKGTALELATFNVKWTKDENAIDGSYAADVTLTVATE